MMKARGKIFSVIKQNFIFILIIMIMVNGIIFYRLRKKEVSEFPQQPNYHFYFIAQNAVDPLWREIRQGVEAAAKAYNIVVEFKAPRFNNPQDQMKYLDIAITSNVDGIITHVSQGEEFTKLINQAYAQGIPVVTIENDDTQSNRRAFIGTNSYLLGKKAGKLMIEATHGKGNIAIITSNDYALDKVSENLKINGFLSTIKGYPNMKVQKIYNSEMGILSAEEIAQKIIRTQPDIQAIYTTNSVDTLGTAQLIVDHNRVGRLMLVGYGDTETILRYIEKGIIYGTVMSDPFKMGYESLKALLDIKEKNNVSTFIDTGVKVIKKGNLENYQEKANFKE